MARQVVRLVKSGCGAAEVGNPTTVRIGKCALSTKVGFCGFIQIGILIVFII